MNAHNHIDAVLPRSARNQLAIIGLSTLLALLAACSTAPKSSLPTPTPPPPRAEPEVRDGPPEESIDIAAVPDAAPRHEPRSKYGNPSSYVEFGERYRVLDHSQGFVQRGLASWYGTKFHGKRTSSGEPYDMFGMTAAHKTLPLPTYVEVTNLDNGRAVVVKVNDRGPFVKGRIIDLSHTAARKLGIIGSGTGRVEIRAIDPRAYTTRQARQARTQAVAREQQVAQSADSQWYLQVGAFTNGDNAERLQKDLYRRLGPDLNVSTHYNDSEKLYRVRVGPLASNQDAEHVNDRLSRLGISNAHLISD